MANIQMTDRNPSDLGIMEEVEELTSEELLDEELTDEELQAIDGGGLGALGGGVAGAFGAIYDSQFNGNPVNWRSVGAWGLAGVGGGAIAGMSGGPWGAGLAGTD
jgi:lactobin A/cerein 7B family class IIb bacteriocin